MAGLGQAVPDLHVVRRVITRSPELGGEDYDAVSVAEFEELVETGALAIHWGAHGLFYGIPRNVMDQLNAGRDCLVNFSRKSLAEAAERFPRLLVLNITADPETLSQRLAARGRETEAEISQRLAQAEKPLPAGLEVIHVSNDGPLARTVAQAARLLQPVRA
jgi:ribose 1,5-bisphosphokinase